MQLTSLKIRPGGQECDSITRRRHTSTVPKQTIYFPGPSIHNRSVRTMRALGHRGPRLRFHCSRRNSLNWMCCEDRVNPTNGSSNYRSRRGNTQTCSISWPNQRTTNFRLNRENGRKSRVNWNFAAGTFLFSRRPSCRVGSTVQILLSSERNPSSRTFYYSNLTLSSAPGVAQTPTYVTLRATVVINGASRQILTSHCRSSPWIDIASGAVSPSPF